MIYTTNNNTFHKLIDFEEYCWFLTTATMENLLQVVIVGDIIVISFRQYVPGVVKYREKKQINQDQ